MTIHILVFGPNTRISILCEIYKMQNIQNSKITQIWVKGNQTKTGWDSPSFWCHSLLLSSYVTTVSHTLAVSFRWLRVRREISKSKVSELPPIGGVGHLTRTRSCPQQRIPISSRNPSLIKYSTGVRQMLIPAINCAPKNVSIRLSMFNTLKRRHNAWMYIGDQQRTYIVTIESSIPSAFRFFDLFIRILRGVCAPIDGRSHKKTARCV